MLVYAIAFREWDYMICQEEKKYIYIYTQTHSFPSNTQNFLCTHIYDIKFYTYIFLYILFFINYPDLNV